MYVRIGSYECSICPCGYLFHLLCTELLTGFCRAYSNICRISNALSEYMSYICSIFRSESAFFQFINYLL